MADGYLDPKAVSICKRYDTLKNAAMPWYDKFQDIALYFAPRYGTVTTSKGPGITFEDNLYEDIGRKSADDASSGFLGQMAPVGQRWFKTEPDWPEPSEGSKVWFQNATITLESLMATSDFYNAVHEDIHQTLCFGTADMIVEEGERNPFKFKSVPIGKYVFENNADDMPDVFYDEYKMTAKQMEEKFGKDALPDKIKDKLKSDSSVVDEHTVIHFIGPREGASKEYPASKDNQPYEEFWIEYNCKKTLMEGGYYENPHIIGRYKTQSDSFWGYSLGMQTLPKVRQLNDMEESRMVILEKLEDPPWLMPDNTTYTPDNRPRGITYFRADAQHLPQQMQLKNDYDKLVFDMAEKKQEVKQAWFLDVFRMLQDMPNEKTATEILALQEEKMVLFSSSLTLYMKEKLNRIIERCFAIALRAGWFGDVPDEILENGAYKVVYTSRIALSAKAQENVSIIQWMRAVREIAEVFPEAAMKIKVPETMSRIGENMGIDPDLLRSNEEVQELLEQQKQQQQMMEAAQMAETGTKAISNLK